MKTPTLIAFALAAGTLCLTPGAEAKSWSELAAAAVQAEQDKHQRGAFHGNRDSAEQRRDNRRDRHRDAHRDRRDNRRDHRRDHWREHRNFDRHHRNVRRAMRRHGISRFDDAVWTGNGFRVSGFTAHGLIDIVFGYPHYAVHSVAHRQRSRGRYWNDWNHGPRYRDDYRPRHNNRRPLKERRVRRIAARRYGMDVYRTRCVDGRWILVGHRHGHRHGRYKLVLDAYTGRELAFHRVRGHR